MLVLVDIDGVLADLESGFLKIWKQTYPKLDFIPLHLRRTYRIIDQYPPEVSKMIGDIILGDGFYDALKPISGAKEALLGMIEEGLEVFICSTPAYDNLNSALDKYRWINRHLGSEWTRRVILTSDRTLIKADLLIDDNPIVTGLREPEWEHVVFDRPYNLNVIDKRRLSWNNWRGILGI